MLQASTLDKSLGSCVFCHRVMMMLSLKRVPCTVYPDSQHKYKQHPVLFIPSGDGRMDDYEDINEIEAQLFKVRPSLKWNHESPEEDVKAISESDPRLEWNEDPKESVKLMKKRYHLVEAMVSLGEGSKVFKNFYAYIKNRDASSEEMLKGQLLSELGRLNTFMQSQKSPGKFLYGDKLRYPDCVLLPKLLHIKTVLKYLKDVDIPEDLTAIHSYMAAASQEEAFAGTSPSEQVINDAYENQLGLVPKNLLKGAKHR